MKKALFWCVMALLAGPAAGMAQDGALTLRLEPPAGQATGVKVVLVSGDEEYRSEESCPMLAKILSQRFGFEAVVVFAINPATGLVDPNSNSNLPGLEELADADLLIIGTRFRQLDETQYGHLAAYLNAGKPVIGFRTATHAFTGEGMTGDFAWKDFGLNILGERWVNHHGKHKVEGTRGFVEEANANHPVLHGVKDVFGPSDVYGIANLDESKARILMRGGVTETLDPESALVPGEKNAPMMPMAWLREYDSPDGGVVGLAFCTTMGASVDFVSEGLRRLVVNAALYLTGQKVPEMADVDFVDPFEPTFYSFIREEGYYANRGLKPAMYGLGSSPATGLPAAGEAKPKAKAKPKAEPKAAAPKGGTALTIPLAEAPVHPMAEKVKGAVRPSMLPLEPRPGETIALIGNSLGERMDYFGHFETVLQRRFPEARLVVRNLCVPGDTPGLRPHSGRTTPWAFPGAEAFHPDTTTHYGEGHYPYPDEWLTAVKADTIIGFFGFNESFDGIEKVGNFEGELRAFIDHTRSLAYGGKGEAPRLVLVTPIAFEDLSGRYDLPGGETENERLSVYAHSMMAVAQEKGVGVVDLFSLTKNWFAAADPPYTINGAHLGDRGYRDLAPELVSAIFGSAGPVSKVPYETVREAVLEKTWMWQNDYRMLNGVHAYGRRWKPYGNFNYPQEMAKIREMVLLRDEAIWDVAAGRTKEPEPDDAATLALTPVETNYRAPIDYLSGEEARERFDLPEGYAINLFASEETFPMLGNPVQMSFDARGRLWVSTIQSYPHYQPGGPRPDDKILILEDTDGDGKADKQTVFADKLHLPIGFELAPEGVWVSEEPNLVLLQDTDGDDVADERHIMLGGFDSHDTHHAISAYCADASGAFYLSEGRFLHSQVETPYGPQRMTDGGVWRFDPRSWRLERFSQADYNNPWAVAFNEFGQNFVGDASGGDNYWLLPLSIKVPHGKEINKEAQFTTFRVRPTSGAEFLYSRHFPDEVQGDYLLNNTIGFLGTKQHKVWEDGAGYTGELRQDLVVSDDPNFRPSDLEIGPDGALYIVDWHNALVGHMQHSARDPNRNSEFGRIWRVTYPSRPLVTPPKIEGEPVAALLKNLELDEYRARYRTRRELREHAAEEVIPAAKAWAASLDPADPKMGRHLLEALWVTWAQGRPDRELLEQCLDHGMHEVRAGATRVLRHAHDHVAESTELFLDAARDDHPQVRLEALAAASWLDNADGARIAAEVMKKPVEKWMGAPMEAAMWTLEDDLREAVESGLISMEGNPTGEGFLAGRIQFKSTQKEERQPMLNVPAKALALYKLGEEVYARDAHCATCHQKNGEGIPNIYPPLTKNEWVGGDPERLIKMVLHGLWGPMEVGGVKYDPAKGVPPMTGLGGILTDEEVAGVLTYVRYSFKNSYPMVTPEEVARVREATKDRTGFYMVDELLKENPFREGE